MAIITIVGSGMMGSAMAYPARENGNEVRLVGTHLDREIIDVARKTNRHIKFDRDFPEGCQFYQIEEVDEALKDADVVICGVSSFGVDWFGEMILPKIKDNQLILSITKGLIKTDDDKLITYPAYWRKKTDKKLSINAVGGPCISFDLVAHDQTEVAFCGQNVSELKKLRDLFSTDYYHISVSVDEVGVESAVALKNGYALGIAMAVGLDENKNGKDAKKHYNGQAAIFGQSVREMTKLLDFQNALNLDSQVIGFGDLYVTVYGGRTRQIGILLGKGMDIIKAKEELAGVTLESLVIIDRVAKAVIANSEKGILDKKDFPLLMHINDVLNNKTLVNIPWNEFRHEKDELK